MDSGTLAGSAETLIHIFVVLLYLPVCLITYRWLFPHLSPTAKRLASVMLVAQILVVVASLAIQPTSIFDDWLWHLDRERNLPAAFAATQLSLVGFLAILVAWLARTRPAWDRVYFLGLGWLFLHLARDEFYVFHESYAETWQLQYAEIGAAAVLATLLVAVRSPRSTRKWHLLLITGLAISGFGALIIEEFRYGCVNLFIPVSGCVLSYQYEEIFELLGIWLALCAVLGQFSAITPTPHRAIGRLLYFLPILSVVMLLLPFLFSLLEIRYFAQSARVRFESNVSLQAYRVERHESSLAVKIFMSSKSWHNFTKLGYSVHLVEQVSGESVASADEAEHRLHGWRIYLYDFGTKYCPWIQVNIPKSAPTNRAFLVVLTLWRKEGEAFVRQKVLSSDHQLLSETQVVLGELVNPAKSAATSLSTPVAVFDSGFTLESADMPDHAKAGETLAIPFFWRSDVDGSEDFVQFLHFGHEDSDFWWGFDQQPLGARLPTRLWYSGLADSEVWQVPFPADLAPGRYAVYTGLYRLRDQERLPVSDTDGTPFVDARVPLGDITIER